MLLLFQDVTQDAAQHILEFFVCTCEKMQKEMLLLFQDVRMLTAKHFHCGQEMLLHSQDVRMLLAKHFLEIVWLQAKVQEMFRRFVYSYATKSYGLMAT